MPPYNKAPLLKVFSLIVISFYFLKSFLIEEVRQVLSQYADCTLAKELGGVPFFYEAKLLSRDAGQVVSTEVVGGSASNKKQLRGGGGLVYGEVQPI